MGSYEEARTGMIYRRAQALQASSPSQMDGRTEPARRGRRAAQKPASRSSKLEGRRRRAAPA